MKKILFALFALLLSVNAMAYKDDLSVKSGDINIMKQAGAASFSIDYSQVKVGDLTLAEYAKTRTDSDFMENFQKDIKNGENAFAKFYNKKSKKFKFNQGGQYAATLVLETMDMGNLGAALFGWSLSNGGIIISGNLILKDVNTGETVLVIRVDNEKGSGAYTESGRMQTVFEQLAKAVLKLTK